MAPAQFHSPGCFVADPAPISWSIGSMSPQTSAKLAGAAVVLLALAILGGSATYVVPPGHRGVMVTLGKVSPEARPEGFGFKSPFVTTMVPMSVRQRSAAMKASVI